jgi:hypothetical protein
VPNPSPKTVILQSEPGMGKSVMLCCTAINKPVHVVDIDRKIRSAGWAQPLIQKGELTYWELNEPYDEENIKSRLNQLVKNEKPMKQPMGVTRFAEYMYRLADTEEGKRAGTWGIDSWTLLNEHVKSHIMYIAGHNKFQFDEWAALKSWHMQTVSFLRDLAKEHGKDLVFTVHEREGEKAGDRTSGVKYETDAKGNRQRVRQGTQELKIWASIDGAFGELFGATVDEYYHLYVDVNRDTKTPQWRCRIHPDGVRSLRTSFMHKESVFDPDFRKIWR